MAKLSSQPTSIQTLYGWFRSGKLNINRRYQRKLVWTLKEKQKLIDTLLRSYPVPAILLASSGGEEDVFEVIDGMQRLHAIMSFIETSYPIEDGRFFDVSKFPTAADSCDREEFIDQSNDKKLSVSEITGLLDYSVAVSIMKINSDAEVNEVFGRINTYGHRLSDQERRQAGVTNAFAEVVRDIACEIRGDASPQTLPLYKMPSVSIDLPKMRHGYNIQAKDVFFVKHGILRASDLRDSMDEQCVADILACIVRGELIDRSRTALDQIYSFDHSASERVLAALTVYGEDKLKEEFRFIIQEVSKIVDASEHQKLSTIIFGRPAGNAYPAIFAALFISMHGLMKAGKVIGDYRGVATALWGIDEKLNAGQKGSTAKQRKTNIDVITGLIQENYVDDNSWAEHVYAVPTSVDLENYLRRSTGEEAGFEFKQGLLDLVPDATNTSKMIQKIATTVCAMANASLEYPGRILIGVCDKEADAERIKRLHNVEPRNVAGKFIVGVAREAEALGYNLERYFQIIRDGLLKSGMNEPLVQSVVSELRMVNYYDLNIVVISIPKQNEISFVNDKVYIRKGDQTVEVNNLREVSEITRKFG